jgi:hypothetical protein
MEKHKQQQRQQQLARIQQQQQQQRRHRLWPRPLLQRMWLLGGNLAADHLRNALILSVFGFKVRCSNVVFFVYLKANHDRV